MTQAIEKTKTLDEQRLLLPGNYTWQYFERLQKTFANSKSIRLTYLDGYIEIMTVGEGHEFVKKMLAILLEAYFFEREIEFIPVGNATRKSEKKEASFEPDESYYVGAKGDNSNLAIEVILTSGNINKLEKYKRFDMTEVWFWENDRISIYRLENGEYERRDRSEICPDLDPELLARCVRIPSRIEARNALLQSLRKMARGFDAIASAPQNLPGPLTGC